MKTKQFFETTVMSEATEHAAHVIVIPAGALDPNGIQAEAAVEELGLMKLGSTSPSMLPFGLATLFSLSASPQSIPESLTQILTGKVPERSADLEFGEQIAFQPVIPIQQSPLKLESLASLITSASGAGLGAYVGFVIGGTSPLLLVTVPAGMIILGAAKGVASALEEGLRDRLLQIIRGGEPKEKAESRKPERRKDG